MLVPEKRVQVPSLAGTDERISDPGAATSGFIRSDTGVGPADENSETTSARPDCVVVTEPTVIAFAVVPGEPTEPPPKSSKSFPAEMTGTTPASAAASSAAVTMSRVGSVSGSPSERLSTSIPSATAASMPAAISGEFPLRPSPGVGIVSTL